jgi:uncharacterized protein YgiM (DUF1202 family)
MKKATFLTVILGLLVLAVLGLILKNTIFKPADAGLQVKSVPASTVFLSGKNLGQTPYDDQKLASGEVTLRLVPESTTGNFSPWETKIKLVRGTQTIVNWEFSESESSSSGEIMTLEKISDKKSASLMVISSPDSSLVKVDGEPKGFTPVSLDKLEPQERQITLSASGFAERTVNVKLLEGFKLILNVKLAEKGETPIEEISPTPEPTTKAGTKVSPTPTPKPAGKITPSPVSLKRPYVTIKETPTGFLRVRSEPSTNSTELVRVSPGESFSLVDEQSGWYKITYQTDKDGWISGQYAEKFE